VRILIAEDEERIARFVARGLRANGYTPTVVGDGIAAWDLASSGEHDLLILDIGLPLMDGFTVLRRLREAKNRIPVVILSARDSVTDTVAGLDLGADDYVSKPFAFDELLARVRLRLRSAAGEPEVTVLRNGPLTMDLQSRRVLMDGRPVELSVREFALAEAFVRNQGLVLGRDTLLGLVWGHDADPSSNIVDVYVQHLRRKLGPQVVQTVRGVGYRMVALDA
jgi:DNA-binding response OmpR family regulator